MKKETASQHRLRNSNQRKSKIPSQNHNSKSANPSQLIPNLLLRASSKFKTKTELEFREVVAEVAEVAEEATSVEIVEAEVAVAEVAVAKEEIAHTQVVTKEKKVLLKVTNPKVEVEVDSEAKEAEEDTEEEESTEAEVRAEAEAEAKEKRESTGLEPHQRTPQRKVTRVKLLQIERKK